MCIDAVVRFYESKIDYIITLNEMLFKLNLYSLPSIISFSHIGICFSFLSSSPPFNYPFPSLLFSFLFSLVSDNEDALKSVLLRENISLKAKVKLFEKNEMENVSRLKSPGYIEFIDAESDEVFLSAQLKLSKIFEYHHQYNPICYNIQNAS